MSILIATYQKGGLNGTLLSDRGPISLTMDSSPKDGKVGVLTVLITGEKAQKFNKMGKEYRKQVTIKTLTRFYGKKAASPLCF